MTKIAILDDYQGVALVSADWSKVAAVAELTVFNDHLDDPDALVERLEPFDAICVMRERTPLPREVLERLPRLRFIGSNGARNALIDLAAAKKQGITVCSTRSLGSGAPELTWALILAAARHMPRETESVRAGGWQTSVGSDLAGKTLGVIGLGKIGKQVAAAGRAFGMEIIAWSDNLTEQEAKTAGARLVDKQTLLKEADWVTLHLVLSPRSRGTIGADELALMKPTAWLVNAARGPLVDEAALIDTLQRRAIAGAALDVFNVEPLPTGHPFRVLPNVLATPHLGFVTEKTYAVFYQETIENILAWIDGSPIREM